MLKIAKITEWDAHLVDESHSALESAFADLSIFGSIFIPVKTPTADGMPENFTYQNIGMTGNELATAYKVLYGENYLSVPFISGDYGYTESRDKLKAKIQSIYKLNKYKYLKAIELMGYEYNPLYNVDGEETFTYLENQGVNDITKQSAYTAYTDTTGNSNIRTGSVTGASSETHADTAQVTSFDSSTFEDKDHTSGNVNTTGATTTYNNLTDTATGSVSHGAHTDTDTTTVTHHNALNGSSDYSGGTDLFGNSVTGGDKYHTEKRLRQGNIGVTKTQELIEAERNNLRFSLIQEFFEDINKILLVGIYDL